MNSSQPRELPNWSARQVVYATLFVVSVLLAFWLLYRFSRVAFILFVAIVLGTAIRPAVDWLNQRGLSRPAGVILIYFLLLAFIIGVMMLIAPIIVNQLTEISFDIPKYYGNFRNSIFQSPNRILQRIAIQMPLDLRMIPAQFPADETQPLDSVSQTMLYMGLTLRGLLTLVAMFLLAFYWTLESERTIRSLLFWFPISRRDTVRELIAEIEARVGGFIVGQGLLCLAIGLMALVAYLVIGLPYALVLAILAGLFEAVPVFGPALGAVPALLVALSTDPIQALWVLIATGIIQVLENFLLVPRIMNRSVGVNPMVTLLALAAFTSLLGLPGALLAVPMAAIIQLLLDRFLLAPTAVEIQEEMGRDQLSFLRYEAQDLASDVRKQLRLKENLSDGSSDKVEDAIEAIASDLDTVLAQIAINNEEMQA